MVNKKTITGLILASCSIFLVQCYKNKSLILDAPEITRTVTFSQDLMPVFNSSCNMSGCHSAGGQAPNLTEASAFNSLTIGNYFDKSAPDNSLLYLKITGKKGTPMPPSGVNKDFAALVLAWIKQGADNN